MKSPHSLTVRITLVLVGFAGLIMSGNGMFSYLSGRRAMETATASELLSVTMQKEESVIHWIRAQENDIEILGRSQTLLNILLFGTTMDKQPDPAATLRARLKSQLTPFMSGKLVDPPLAMAIAGPDGTVLAGTDSRLDGISIADLPEFIDGRLGTYLRPAHRSRLLNLPVMAISTPLRSAHGQLLGVLISWPRIEGLDGKVTAKYDQHATEEAYLLDRQAFLLTPPRAPGKAVLRDRIDSPTIRRCLAGVHQVSFDPDERGIPAVAVCRWIPEYAMALVERRDQREALAPVREFGRSVAYGSLAALLAATLIAVWLARTITHPIRLLSASVKRFGQGAYHGALSVTSNDEVASLTREFNRMAQAILEKERQLHANAASLEQRAQESTHVLLQQANLLELAYDGIIVTDMERRIQLWNNGAADMFGWPRPDAMGREVHALLHTRFPVSVAAIYSELDRAGFWKGELQQRRRDGGLVVTAARKAIQRDDTGKPVAILTVLSDITDRKQAEAILRESEERTRRIVDSAYDAYVAVDSGGRIIDWNRQSEAMFGWPREEALDKLVYDVILPPRHRAMHEVSMKDLIATGEGPALRGLVEITGMDRTRREFPIELTIARIWHGKMPVFSAFVRDITRRKQTEQDLKSAKEAAEAATRAKSDFLANMSHEIRTPMNGIIGLTKLALKLPLPPQPREYLGMIEISAESLLHLVNDILDFSKLEARKLDLECIDFDVRDVLRNSLRVFSSAVSEKGLELIAYVAPDVPPVLNGDPGRLHQIITNLVSNAIKFTSHGEIVVRLSSGAAGDGHRFLRLCVSDTGIGVSADKQARIFEAFMQADTSTTRMYGGTGLGLAIVSQLTSLMQGSIHLDSEAGRGAAFHLSLRFGEPASPSPAGPARIAMAPGMSAMIVDDNAVSRQVLVDMLRDAGMDAVAVESPDRAKALLSQREAGHGPFALTLLDSGIPGHDAFAAARDLQSAPGAGKIVMMLSSPDFGEEAGRCEALGLAHALRKPVISTELIDTLLHAMGAHPGQRPPPDRISPAFPARPLRVLIAEDHPINQKLLSHVLAERGHAYAIANNGHEALDMAQRQSFDVILMDGQMPQMDGYQATLEIRRREQATGRHTRIIAVTAHALREERLRCLDVGMDSVICKPVDPDRLLEVLESGQAGPADAGAPAEAAARSAVFDKARLLDRVHGKTSLLDKMIQAFLQDLPATVDEVRFAASAADMRALEAASHRLKGAAATLCANRLADVAGRLELHGRRHETGPLAEAIAELQACACELSIELEFRTEYTL